MARWRAQEGAAYRGSDLGERHLSGLEITEHPGIVSLSPFRSTNRLLLHRGRWIISGKRADGGQAHS